VLVGVSCPARQHEPAVLKPFSAYTVLLASVFGDGVLVIDLLYVALGTGFVLPTLCPASSHVISLRLCVCVCLSVCLSVRLLVYVFEAPKFCLPSGIIFKSFLQF